MNESNEWINVLGENTADNDLASLVTLHLKFVPSTCDKAISVWGDTVFALVLPCYAQPKGGKFKTNRELLPGVFRAWYQVTCRFASSSYLLLCCLRLL